jgi:hypothetical protein
VFGFDLGTASIGYAVRKGDQFLDVGVLLCPENLGELADRRALRRQRRTIRSRKDFAPPPPAKFRALALIVHKFPGNLSLR